MPSSSNTKSKSTSRKSSKESQGSVGFVNSGSIRQGLFCVFKSNDKNNT